MVSSASSNWASHKASVRLYRLEYGLLLLYVFTLSRAQLAHRIPRLVSGNFCAHLGVSLAGWMALARGQRREPTLASLESVLYSSVTRVSTSTLASLASSDTETLRWLGWLGGHSRALYRKRVLSSSCALARWPAWIPGWVLSSGDDAVNR